MNENLHKGASPDLFHYARKNRSNQTKAEKMLWDELRNRKLDGFKFRRLHPLKDFIVDFYCHEFSLVVELDGEYHSETEQAEYDSGRTFELEGLGFEVIRFHNKAIEEDIKIVLEKISKYLQYTTKD